jgi:hypothetical protein
MKKYQPFNYIRFFIFLSIAAFLSAFVYLQIIKDYKNSKNYKESFINIPSFPKINSIYRPMMRNARLSINNSVNSFSTKIDNYLRKNNWIA